MFFILVLPVADKIIARSQDTRQYSPIQPRTKEGFRSRIMSLAVPTLLLIFVPDLAAIFFNRLLLLSCFKDSVFKLRNPVMSWEFFPCPWCFFKLLTLRQSWKCVINIPQYMQNINCTRCFFWDSSLPQWSFGLGASRKRPFFKPSIKLRCFWPCLLTSIWFP